MIFRIFWIILPGTAIARNLVTHAIPECGHLPHEEKPEEINRLLIDFLAGLKG